MMLSDNQMMLSDNHMMLSDNQMMLSDNQMMLSDNQMMLSDNQMMLSDIQMNNGNRYITIYNCFELCFSLTLSTSMTANDYSPLTLECHKWWLG